MANMISEEGLDLLILQAKAGDLDAFEVIGHRFQDMAVGYAYSVLGDFHLAQATFHQGSILEMARLIPEAKHNATSIARCAWLASKFGYHTGSIFRIAQHASRSEFERPEIATLAELAVRKLSETQRMVQLAEQVAGPLNAEEQEQLGEEIARLDASADFSTLKEALERQAARAGLRPRTD